MSGHNLQFSFPPMLPTEIRLLYLQPAYYFGYAIICSLKTLRRSAAKDRYEALSYVWGLNETVNLRRITVNGKIYHITPNLDSALRHLRSSTYVRPLWVDAICLNQNDVDEKNQVVPEMHLIYGSAKTVVVWAENALPGTERALDLINTLSRVYYEPLPPEVTPTEGWNYIWDWIKSKQSEGLLPLANDERWTDLNFLSAHEWLTRVWTLQEVVHARVYRLMWSTHTVSGPDLAEVLRMMRLMESQGLISASIASKLDYILETSWQFTDIERYRTMLRERKPISLATALGAPRYRSATVKHDHVYGCLSLAHNGPQVIAVDYAKPVSDVFEDATRALVDEGQSHSDGFNFLAACSLIGTHELDGRKPSWAVVFGRPSDHSIICRPFGNDFGFFAAGRHPGVAVRGTSYQGLSTLTVRGHLFAQVEIISSIHVPSEKSGDIGKDDITIQEFYTDCRNILLHTVSAKTTDEDRSIHWNLDRTLICGEELSAAELPGFNGTWSPMYMRFAKPACYGRRFFITSTGYIGLAPHVTEIGDHVHLIAGCDVPLILRKTTLCTPSCVRIDKTQQLDQNTIQTQEARNVCQEDSCFQIVGNAYVDGIMHGEAVPLDADGSLAFKEVHLH